MGKYLNKEGLQKLWDKTKELVENSNKKEVVNLVGFVSLADGTSLNAVNFAKIDFEPLDIIDITFNELGEILNRYNNDEIELNITTENAVPMKCSKLSTLAEYEGIKGIIINYNMDIYVNDNIVTDVRIILIYNITENNIYNIDALLLGNYIINN